MDDFLSPCPFCGARPRLNGDEHWTLVTCDCGACGPACEATHEAIAAWNTRMVTARRNMRRNETVLLWLLAGILAYFLIALAVLR